MSRVDSESVPYLIDVSIVSLVNVTDEKLAIVVSPANSTAVSMVSPVMTNDN